MGALDLPKTSLGTYFVSMELHLQRTFYLEDMVGESCLTEFTYLRIP